MNMQQQSISLSTSIHIEKNELMLYSLFLVFGSVTLFVFFTGIHTIIQGVLWKYTISYLIVSSSITLFCLIVATFFFLASYQIIQHKRYSKITGFIACFLLILFTLVILYGVDSLPGFFEYLVFLILPAVALIIVLFFLWKKLP